MIRDPPRVHRVVLRLAGCPGGLRVAVLGPGVHAAYHFHAGLLACGRWREENGQKALGADLGLPYGTHDLRRPAMHAGRAPWGGGREYQLPNDGWPGQRDLLGYEAADGEPEDVDLAKVQGGDEGNRVVCHLLDRVRCPPGRAADSGVVEGHDPPVRG